MSQWLTSEVLDNVRLDGRLTSLLFENPGIQYLPGQFVRVGLPDQDDVLARPYSLVSHPDDARLEIFFNQVEDGPLSPRLFDLEAGDPIYVSSLPSGFLTLQEVPEAEHLWLFATGTGVGPFVSILKDENTWQRFSKVLLVYSVKTAAELAYSDLMESLLRQHTGVFQYQPVVTREDSPNALRQRIPQLIESGALESACGVELSTEHSHFLMCGNQAMIEDVSELLKNRGFRKHRRRNPGHFSTEKYF